MWSARPACTGAGASKKQPEGPGSRVAWFDCLSCNSSTWEQIRTASGAACTPAARAKACWQRQQPRRSAPRHCAAWRGAPRRLQPSHTALPPRQPLTSCAGRRPSGWRPSTSSACSSPFAPSWAQSRWEQPALQCWGGCVRFSVCRIRASAAAGTRQSSRPARGVASLPAAPLARFSRGEWRRRCCQGSCRMRGSAFTLATPVPLPPRFPCSSSSRTRLVTHSSEALAHAAPGAAPGGQPRLCCCHPLYRLALPAWCQQATWPALLAALRLAGALVMCRRT